MRNNHGNSLTYTLIIFLLSIILLVVSNPKQENHIQAMIDNLADKNILTGVVSRTALAVNPPVYHSALVFSYTEQNNKISSVGGLGYVWINKKMTK